MSFTLLVDHAYFNFDDYLGECGKYHISNYLTLAQYLREETISSEPMTYTVHLKFSGAESSDGVISAYDSSYAMLGFQRWLALTTHLICNDEIIVQSPSLKGAEIFFSPPEKGSWEIVAVIVGGIFALGTTKKDTPIGHLIHSIYDFAILKTLGFHVDYDKTLFQQHKEELEGRGVVVPRESPFDSLSDKISTSVRDMHRPIVQSETAESAGISARYEGEDYSFSKKLNSNSFEQMSIESFEDTDFLEGRVSSFNINTNNGRIFLTELGRPVPFSLSAELRNATSITMMLQSLISESNRRYRNADARSILVKGVYIKSSTGTVRRMIITDI